MELPVPMKNVSGVFLDGALYLGGGYTGDSKTDAIVYVYHFSEAKWSNLPPSPIKWSTLTVLGGRLVLAGGRLARRQSNLKQAPSYTNKVVAWDKEKEEWEDLPHMIVPRMSPFLIQHGDNLIAAGGNKGMLDFQAEVYCSELGKWVRGPALPLRCLSNTAAVVGNEWYLADTAATGGGSNVMVQCTSIPDYVAVATQELDKLENMAHLDSLSPAALQAGNNLWRKLSSSPPESPFRIATANSQLMALCDAKKTQANITAYLYQQEVWTKVCGSRLPLVISSGLLLDAEGKENTTYLLGGESTQQSSNHGYELNFMNNKDFQDSKKSRQTKLSVSE